MKTANVYVLQARRLNWSAILLRKSMPHGFFSDTIDRVLYLRDDAMMNARTARIVHNRMGDV